MASKEQLDSFIQNLKNNQCSISDFLNVNIKRNCLLKDANLMYVLQGLNCANIKSETLTIFKEQGMISEDFYNKVSESVQDGVLPIKSVLQLEASEELTAEQKQEQIEALKALESIKSGDNQALNSLSTLTNSTNTINDEATKEAKEILQEKAMSAQATNLELTTNSAKNIQNLSDILRPLSPMFTQTPNYIEAGKVIENAILEGQLSLGASYELLQNIGFNPAQVSDLVKSGNSQSPDFNTDDIASGQSTSGSRLIEAVYILGNKDNQLTYEKTGEENSQTSNDEPKVQIVKNYITNNLITLEEVISLQESGKLYLTQAELESIENMSSLDNGAMDDDNNNPNNDHEKPLDSSDLNSFLDSLMDLDDTPEMSKKSDSIV